MKENKHKTKKNKALLGIMKKIDINPVRAKLSQLNLKVQYWKKMREINLMKLD